MGIKSNVNGKLIEHEWYDEFECPACGHKERDAWELPDDDDEHECGNCGAILSFERQVAISWVIGVVRGPDDDDSSP